MLFGYPSQSGLHIFSSFTKIQGNRQLDVDERFLTSTSEVFGVDNTSEAQKLYCIASSLKRLLCISWNEFSFINWSAINVITDTYYKTVTNTRQAQLTQPSFIVG